ncbi:MAG: peptidase S41 [Gammaproteobacteria bacterium]|nr:MAG: peptidase S41 [Gammaproteobacteria bacterium]RLA14328.1 MAG: peptidase S41 [Gammaproteobacteria bacterium]RLA18121.1 MAG: peptidase S41 [Gammaproteobacteria bacterium]
MRRPIPILILLLLAFTAGGLINEHLVATAQAEAGQTTNTLPLVELRTFSETFTVIKNNYVEPVEDKELLESAIRGMLSGLDPHSSYLDGEDFKQLQEGTSGEFGGLGIEVSMEDGFVKVVSPIDDTPAARAGIQAGDLIIRLDDTPVKGMSLGDAVKIMRGKAGTEILLTLIREGEQKPLKIEIKRAIIQVTAVRGKMLDPGFAYIRVAQFQVNTGRKLRTEVDKLKSENDKPLEGLVLDLRNNPGGVLTAAVSVSDAFITKGLVVYTEGRSADSEQKFNASPDDILGGAPIVVLVNGGSASASEIVAGALQDHGRAIIMGSKTFGKGSVQTILPMKNNAALKLTTARYYTPNGHSIQARGIIPDIELKNIKVTNVDPEFERIAESDLTGHLENEEVDEEDEETEDLASRDFVLYEALNLLKAVAILNHKKAQ